MWLQYIHVSKPVWCSKLAVGSTVHADHKVQVVWFGPTNAWQSSAPALSRKVKHMHEKMSRKSSPYAYFVQRCQGDLCLCARTFRIVHEPFRAAFCLTALVGARTRIAHVRVLSEIPGTCHNRAESRDPACLTDYFLVFFEELGENEKGRCAAGAWQRSDMQCVLYYMRTLHRYRHRYRHRHRHRH